MRRFSLSFPVAGERLMRPASEPTFPGAAPTARHSSCARLLSLADGASGALFVPWALENSAGGPHDPGMLPALGVGAAHRCSTVSVPTPTTFRPTVAAPTTPQAGWVQSANNRKD